MPPKLLILDDGWQTVTPPPTPPPLAPSPPPTALETAAALETSASGVGPLSDRGKGLLLPHTRQRLGRVRAAASAAFATLVSSLSAAFAGWVQALYDRHVARARHGTLPVLLWRLLARTALKGSLGSYFEEETDFGRQLEAFSPNNKFGGGDGIASSLGALVKTVKDKYGVDKV